MITEAEIYELEQFFAALPRPLPNNIAIAAGAVITNTETFIDGHLQTLRAQKDNSRFATFRDRMEELKKYLQAQTAKS